VVGVAGLLLVLALAASVVWSARWPVEVVSGSGGVGGGARRGWRRWRRRPAGEREAAARPMGWRRWRRGREVEAKGAEMEARARGGGAGASAGWKDGCCYSAGEKREKSQEWGRRKA
jgi:hypothetical protein